jgi:hypothetical protein
MGAYDILTSEMRKCYKGCDFVRLDYFGSSKGLISGFNEFLTLDYSTALQLGPPYFHTHSRVGHGFFHPEYIWALHRKGVFLGLVMFPVLSSVGKPHHWG